MDTDGQKTLRPFNSWPNTRLGEWFATVLGGGDGAIGPDVGAAILELEAVKECPGGVLGIDHGAGGNHDALRNPAASGPVIVTGQATRRGIPDAGNALGLGIRIIENFDELDGMGVGTDRREGFAALPGDRSHGGGLKKQPISVILESLEEGAGVVLGVDARATGDGNAHPDPALRLGRIVAGQAAFWGIPDADADFPRFIVRPPQFDHFDGHAKMNAWF